MGNRKGQKHYSEEIKDLEYNLNKIEGIAQSKGMQTRRANFRQE